MTALAALVLAGCGAAPDPVSIDRGPFAPETEIPTHATDGLLLPHALEGLSILDPAWVLPAQGRDGVLLSATERGGLLEYTALDSDGTALWAAQRPMSCTGFVVTVDADGRALAVLTDSIPTAESLASTTASAVDLHTGEPVWGPVEVPGPIRGGGLVFATTPAGSLGALGPATVLDPSTGRVVLTEEGDARRVLGERRGTVLVVQGDELRAIATADGTTLWRADAGELGVVPADLALVTTRAGTDLADGLVLLESAEDAELAGGAGERLLVDLATGAVLVRGLEEARTDALTGITVVRDAAGLRALDTDGGELWTAPVETETQLAAAGNGLLYLRQGDSVAVRNLVTGALAEGYDPEGSGAVVLPVRFTARGAAIVEVGQREVVVTTAPAG